MKKTLQVWLVLLLFCPLTTKAQNINTQKSIEEMDMFDFYDMSLEELENLKATGLPSELEEMINQLIGVASKKAISSRESPGIISLITQEEIKKSGARDLIDVLRLVPGFEFGKDVQNTVGLGVRGNWAAEGKVLLLIDGQEMNEIMYSTIQFGNHYPIENIQKIEIIRGPGSAIYGGFAEYGVINIITKSASELNGIHASGVYGQMNGGYARRNMNLSAGKQWKDFGFSISSLIGQGRRSTLDYVDIYSDTVNLKDNSQLNPSHVNLGINYKKLTLRGMFDQYHVTTGSGFGEAMSKGYDANFNAWYFEAKYDYEVNDKLTITPRFNYKHETPWRNTQDIEEEDDEKYWNYHRTAQRYRGNITSNYKINRKVNLITGAEFFHDLALDHDDEEEFSNGENRVSYNNFAAFTELFVRHRIVNITAGARYDRNTAFDPVFSPRFGLTKKVNNVHFKALYSRAFRAPGIENINLAIDDEILPERTQVFEFETGYQLTRNSIITFNLFDITTFNPIIYLITEDGDEGYTNYDKGGTRGLEMEYRLKEKWGYITLNYAYYTAAGKAKVEPYIPFDHFTMANGEPAIASRSSLLAFANHKVNLNSSFNLTKNLSINPSASFFGERFGYSGAEIESIETEDGEWEEIVTLKLKKFAPILLANLYFNYENLGVKGLSLGAGIYDLFNQRFSFIQPYDGGHNPYPGPTRELVVKVHYQLGMK
jgi:outer membrane receptor for ferrienterochelin and colicin